MLCGKKSGLRLSDSGRRLSGSLRLAVQAQPRVVHVPRGAITFSRKKKRAGRYQVEHKNQLFHEKTLRRNRPTSLFSLGTNITPLSRTTALPCCYCSSPGGVGNGESDASRNKHQYGFILCQNIPDTSGDLRPVIALTIVIPGTID